MITLPRYIVEKVSNGYAIWDTVYHEWTGFEFKANECQDPKGEAVLKCDDINSKNKV